MSMLVQTIQALPPDGLTKFTDDPKGKVSQPSKVRSIANLLLPTAFLELGTIAELASRWQPHSRVPDVLANRCGLIVLLVGTTPHGTGVRPVPESSPRTLDPRQFTVTGLPTGSKVFGGAKGSYGPELFDDEGCRCFLSRIYILEISKEASNPLGAVLLLQRGTERGQGALIGGAQFSCSNRVVTIGNDVGDRISMGF